MLDALVAEARLRWGLDPAQGLQVVAAERLVATPIEPSRPVLIVPLAAFRVDVGEAAVSPLPGRAGPGGGEPLAVLGRLYPAGHAVGRFGSAEETTVAALDAADLAAPLVLGPLAPESAPASPWAMPWISSRLRQPDGCPWDREQTHTSLRNHLLEEAYEVYDALEAGATRELAGELGDLWLQIVLHAQLAAEAGVFDLTDVQEAIASKIVRRHPHVFGDAVARTASDVNRQWERIKADERAAAADALATDGADGPAGGVGGASAASRPPVRRAPSTGSARRCLRSPRARRCRSARPTSATTGPRSTASSTRSPRRPTSCAALPATPSEARSSGTSLFVLVNVARRRGIEAEAAVRAANTKFRRRFASVERQAADRGVALRDLDFEALDALWDAAKAEETTT